MENTEEVTVLKRELHKRDLKIQSFLEKIPQYENLIADLRVELTVSETERSSLAEELSEVRAQLEAATQHAQEAGDVVPEEAAETAAD